jgi:Kef-type K+ transport system membrane component KefB
MVSAAVGLFLLIRGYGEGLTAPPAPASSAGSPRGHGSGFNALQHVLLVLAVVIATGRIMAILFARLGQPPVMGELLAGILLGPSLLGRLSPAAYQALLPQAVAPLLGVISQLGIVLYMFVVGLELNARFLGKRAHVTVAISHASMIVPFLLGACLALFLYPRISSSDVPFTHFALFMGISMAVTAFPVLARILADYGMTRTELGMLALTCAAVDDVTAWCLLALVVGVTQARVEDALRVTAMTSAYVGFVFSVIRPIATRLAAGYEEQERDGDAAAWVFVALLVSALLTEWIGVHALFGAFLLGAVIPHDSRLAHDFTQRLLNVVSVLLLPAFFAFTGMRTQIGLVSGFEEWLCCGLILLVATFGKVGGTLLAARIAGMSWRSSSALGVLMNSRGLMELIVLNIGLDLGVISPTAFAMLVLMALVTTLATAPLLRTLTRGSELEVAV